MNREIKFRIWDLENNKWLTSLGIFDDMDDYNPYNFSKHVGKSVVFLQATGLFDKSGKEIYEGDIVKCAENFAVLSLNDDLPNYTSATVTFVNGGFCFCQAGMEMGRTHLEEFASIVNPDRLSVEVIGNIFENIEYFNE